MRYRIQILTIVTCSTILVAYEDQRFTRQMYQPIELLHTRRAWLGHGKRIDTLKLKALKTRHTGLATYIVRRDRLAAVINSNNNTITTHINSVPVTLTYVEFTQLITDTELSTRALQHLIMINSKCCILL